jgi:hypothetical protein
MTISGTLETFSLPEIFRLIDSGSKSGRLILQSFPDHVNPESHLYYLWFEKGRLIGFSDRLNPQSLIDIIKNLGWLDSETIARLDLTSLKDRPLGTYLKTLNLITSVQLQKIFNLHLDIVYQLFELSDGWFQFDEFALASQIEQTRAMPWHEMTGESIQAAEIVLNALRSQKNWQIFVEQLPEPEYALQKLEKQSVLPLLPLESQIWKLANGRVSLGAIAKKINQSLASVQKTAFCLIMAGLVDEIPVATTNFISAPPMAQTAISDRQILQKPSVSFSFLQNLVTFLRQKLW